MIAGETKLNFVLSIAQSHKQRSIHPSIFHTSLSPLALRYDSPFASVRVVCFVTKHVDKESTLWRSDRFPQKNARRLHHLHINTPSRHGPCQALRRTQATNKKTHIHDAAYEVMTKFIIYLFSTRCARISVNMATSAVKFLCCSPENNNKTMLDDLVSERLKKRTNLRWLQSFVKNNRW